MAGVEVGSRVAVQARQRRASGMGAAAGRPKLQQADGVVRFVGPTEGSAGRVLYGVELDHPPVGSGWQRQAADDQYFG
jgi:hypothetical protein